MTDTASLAPLNVAVGLVSDTIASGGQTQSLRLFLTNSSSAPIPWSPGAGVFTVVPAVGSASGALTTASGFKKSTMTQATCIGSQPWSIATTSRGWSLRPKGDVLLKTGSQGTVAFDVVGLTPPNPGLSQVEVQYSGGSAYRADSLAFPVAVVPGVAPSITTFTGSTTTCSQPPLSVDLTSGDTEVTLTFQVANATTVQILGAAYLAAATATETSVRVSVAQTTTFTLVAIGNSGQCVSKTLEVTVTPALYDILPAGSIMLWSGDVTDIPPGWHLCDGSAADIPDLRDQFVLAAGGTQAAQATGGPDPHTHTGAVAWTVDNADSHNHVISATTSGLPLFDIPNSASLGVGVSEDPNHIHPLLLNQGATAANTTGLRPAWLSLGYVVKLN
jgi:hypothetical protein